MSEHRITIPGTSHGWLFTTPDDMHVVIYETEDPTHKVTVDPSAITVDPATHDVTITLTTSGTRHIHVEEAG